MIHFKKPLIRLISLVMSILVLGSSIALAADTNIDGSGGSMDTVTGDSVWKPGNEGVRVTLVDASSGARISDSLDIRNSNTDPQCRTSFDPLYGSGYGTKLENRSGFSPTVGPYHSKIMTSTIPRIISQGGSTNIAAVKAYFGAEANIKIIADLMGLSLDDINREDRALMLEPIAYFKFMGQPLALTATEAAQYNKMSSQAVRKSLGRLTNQNLPLSMQVFYTY